MRKTIISITTLALEKDSRTLKIAVSAARLGYHSIAVEKNKSQADFSHLKINVISLSEKKATSIGNIFIQSNLVKDQLLKISKLVWDLARNCGLGWFNDLISYHFFKKYFQKEYCLSEFQFPNADVYIFHSYEYTDFALSLPKDVKIVYDAHDFYQEVSPANSESSLVRNWILPFRKSLEKKIIDRANLFTTVSEGLVRKYNKIFQKDPLIFYNTHDFRNDVKDCTELRGFLNLKTSDIIVCSVGNKKPGMVFEELIYVFSKKLFKIHLVFIGDGYDEIKTSYPNIHFISSVNPNQLVPFIKSANFGIVPYFALTENYKYALPNRFFQMIAAEIPILFSSDLKEIVNLNNKFEFGVPLNIMCVEEVERSMNILVSNQKQYKENVSKAATILNWENEEKKLKLLLETLCVN